jgi:enamine deaminase RidA (YjgF/YER057c/UK114 family)
MRFLNPPGWPRAAGYSNGVAAEGRQVFVSGQIGWDENSVLVDGGLAAQIDQALANCLTVLAEADATAEHIARMTWLVADRSDYNANKAAIGEVYRRHMGRHYPAMSLYEVKLLEPGALVEIEVTAVVPFAREPEQRSYDVDLEIPDGGDGS